MYWYAVLLSVREKKKAKPNIFFIMNHNLPLSPTRHMQKRLLVSFLALFYFHKHSFTATMNPSPVTIISHQWLVKWIACISLISPMPLVYLGTADCAAMAYSSPTLATDSIHILNSTLPSKAGSTTVTLMSQPRCCFHLWSPQPPYSPSNWVRLGPMYQPLFQSNTVCEQTGWRFAGSLCSSGLLVTMGLLGH
jgi:hypothetical protein